MSRDISSCSAVLAEAQRRQHSRTVTRLAEVLRLTLRIPDGVHLVPVLGDGSESDNRAALRTWVTRALLELDDHTAVVVLPPLLHQLAATLRRWEEQSW